MKRIRNDWRYSKNIWIKWYSNKWNKGERKSSDKLNPYIVLESKPDDSLEIIRKRYLKLSKEHHPDLLISKGVPQEVLDESKAKMRAVNSAWSQIQKLKNQS